MAASIPADPAHKKYDKKLCSFKKGDFINVFKVSFEDTSIAMEGAFIKYVIGKLLKN